MTAPPIEQSAAVADLQHQLGLAKAEARGLASELHTTRCRIEAAVARVNQGDVFDDPARVVLLLVDLRDILTGRTTSAV